MKITKLHSLTFQRNGVAGEPFYVASFDFKDGKHSGKKFIASFKTREGDDKMIDIASCRVVNPDNPTNAWRGDNFAYELQTFLNEMVANAGEKDFYDLTTNEFLYRQQLESETV